jgi:OHCU decarboxylase
MKETQDFRDPDRDRFMERYGSLYEHSPWIAEAVFDTLGSDPQSLQDLDQAFRLVVLSAGLEQQFELLNAHPELACALAGPSQLTPASSEEQSSAGLDQCNEAEYAEFADLNRTYRETFGFPFIVAVRGYRRPEILEIFRQRLSNDADSEFSEAIRQVCRIGRLRLEALFYEQ